MQSKKKRVTFDGKAKKESEHKVIKSYPKKPEENKETTLDEVLEQLRARDELRRKMGEEQGSDDG